MDQSASEIDDNISPHLDRVTKDQLYSAYRKVQTKYHKYRGRYTDLAAHYRELDRVKSRLESVLVETQDKVLRRITDLKEQCQLEQQAKAHLEEALRNDIEEKDHIINTLNTKIKLLQTSGPSLDNSVSEERKENSKDNLIDLTNETSNGDENNTLSAENAQLKDKLKKLENLVLKYKESLKRNKEKFTEVMKEKSTLENDYTALTNSTADKISAMEAELSTAHNNIEKLTEQVNILHKREEESAISLAENKLSVHRELEEKEEQIKQLQIDLKHTIEDRENLNEIIVKYKTELGKLKSSHTITTDKDTTVHETKEKTEGVRSSQQAAIRRDEIDHSEETRSEKDENILEELTIRLREKEVEFQGLQCKLEELEKQNVEYRHDKEGLHAQLTTYKETYSELKDEYNAQKIITEEKQKDANATIEKLQATVQSVDKELENMRNALIDRDQVCENYNKKIQQYTAMLEKTKHKLTEQETQIKSLKDKLEDKTELSEMQKELENKKSELSAVQNELEFCKSMIDDLKNKVQADNSALSLLKKERSDLINRLVYYNDCIQRLKQDCINVKSVVKEEFLNQKAEISNLNVILAMSFVKLEEENVTLKSEVNNLHSKIKNIEQFTSKEVELQSELTQVVNLKSMLEAELKQTNEQVKEITLKNDQYDELKIMNSKLTAEIDNLTSKIHDLEKASYNLTESQQEVKVLQERLRALENLESVNHALSIEIDDLREKHTQASHIFKEVDELNVKLREATDIINLLKSESSDKDALREELHTSKLEIARLKDGLAEKEGEIKKRDERLTNEEEHIALLKSTCDAHAQKIEESLRDYQSLKAEYQAASENHVKGTAELMENNKDLQETINAKLAQLKKMKMIKERQSKTIEEMNAELDELKSKHAELSNMLETSEKQIESLKLENAQLAKITLENKDLKDKHNDLLSRNQKLCENEEDLKEKIGNYQRDIEELRKTTENCVESYKSQLNNQNKETERLNNELTVINTQLEYKNTELNSLSERLMMSEKELQKVTEKLDEQNSELHDKVSKLDAAVTSSNILKEENEQLLVELKSLRDEIVRIKDIENKNVELKSELNDFIQKNSDAEAIRLEYNKLIAEQASLKDKMIELENLKSCNIELKTNLNNLQSKISSLNDLRTENNRLQSELDTLQSEKNSSTELDILKNLLTEKDAEIRLLEDKNSNMLQEIGNLRQFSLEIDEKRKEVDTLKNLIAPLEEKVVSLQSEINSFVRMNDTLREELEIARNDTKCQLDNDKLREENKRLEAQLDEALITFQAKETQMTLMNNELKTQTNQLKEDLKTSEEEQGMRLKQLVKEFQAQLHDKEEELQAALEKRFGKIFLFKKKYIYMCVYKMIVLKYLDVYNAYLIFIDRQQNYESNLVQQYKEQLKDCQIELTEKSEQLETLVLEKKDAETEKGKDIDYLMETIAQIKKEHSNEIKEIEKKWKAIVQQKIDNLQGKHEEELNELTKEWQNERKVSSQF